MDAYCKSIHLMGEAVVNIRSVYSLGAEEFFLAYQQKLLEQPYEDGRREAIKTGLAFGFSKFLLYFSIGLIYYLGALIA